MHSRVVTDLSLLQEMIERNIVAVGSLAPDGKVCSQFQ